MSRWLTAVRTAQGTVHRTIPILGHRRGIAFPANVGDEVELLAGYGSVIAIRSLT